jgi:hypothetical protein
MANLILKYYPRKFNFSVDAICTMDVNKDGILDIVLGGNQYEFKPQFSRLDTNLVVCYLEKNGTYSWTPYSKSGFFMRESETSTINKRQE